MSDLLRANYYYLRSPQAGCTYYVDKGAREGLFKGSLPNSLPVSCGMSSFPHLPQSYLCLEPGKTPSSSRGPGLPRRLGGATSGPPSVPAWPHCAGIISLFFSLHLSISMGAPEDRSSLAHPCVPKAPDSGPLHHCSDATSYPQESCSWGIAGTRGPQPRNWQRTQPPAPCVPRATGQSRHKAALSVLNSAGSAQDKKSHSTSTLPSCSLGSEIPN